MKIQKTTWAKWRVAAIAAVAILVASSLLMFAATRVWRGSIGSDIRLSSAPPEQFPTYAPGTLSASQQKLVATLQTEYDAQPPGTKYAQGVRESWCADFVSWVMKQNGVPFENPNSGGWRIPGTITLREYFIARGVWHSYGSGYAPRIGDIAIYDGNGPFGQHTNFVLNYENSTLTTLGGNENGKIHVQHHALNNELKVLGFASFADLN